MVEFDPSFHLKSEILQKTFLHYDPGHLLSDLKKVESLFDHRNQICINSELNSPDPLFDNIGKVKNNKEPYCEVLNEPFKGLIFEQILKDLDCVTTRARIMKLQGRSCYSFHWDTTPRFHVPLETNKNSFLFFDNYPPFHLPADGSVYWLDTRMPHTALNCDLQPRYHLVIIDPTAMALPQGGYR